MKFTALRPISIKGVSCDEGQEFDSTGIDSQELNYLISRGYIEKSKPKVKGKK